MTAVAPSLRPVPTLRDLPRIDAAVRATALRVFSHIRNGELEIVEDDGLRHRFGSMATFPVRAVLRVHRPSFYRALLRGSIGAAEELDQLRALLSTLTITEILAQGLHEFLDMIQRRLIAITRDLSTSFFGTPPRPAQMQTQSAPAPRIA